MSNEKVYYKRLDILRIVSCILIFLYHLNILQGGFLAVCTFFALSGYLSYVSAFKKEKFSIKNYYINRIKKIYIPLVVVIFATIIISKVLSLVWINLKPESFSALFGYNNYWQLNANLDYFTKHIDSPFIHLWYISILMQFELVFPLAFKMFKTIDKKINKHFSTIIILAVTTISIAFFFYMSNTQELMTVYYGTFTRLFSILCGVLLGILHCKYNIKLSMPFRKFKSIIYIVYLLLLIGMCFFVTSDSPQYSIYMFVATIISCRLIEYATMKYKKEEKKSRVLDFLSKSSYEVYLVQYPVIFFIQSLQIDNLTKIPLIVITTLLISFALHVLLNNITKNIIGKIAVCLLVCSIIIAGGYILATQEDITSEMQDLEELLIETENQNEDRKNEFLNRINNLSISGDIVLDNTESDKEKIESYVTNLPVVGVGDSVLLAASPGLYKRFPNGYFDGKVSRTILGGRDVLLELQSQGKLGDIIIVALANNGDYIEKRNRNFIEMFQDKEIYWVNAVLADVPEFNDRFKELAKEYPNVHIVDWVEASKNHPEYFYGDGIHVKGVGVSAYADVVFDAICKTYLDNNKNRKNELLSEHEEMIKNLHLINKKETT